VIVLVLLALGIYETARWVRTAPAPGGRFPQGALQTVGAAAAVLGDVRVILNELGTVTPLATVGANADQRPIDRRRIHRRAIGEKGRFPRANPYEYLKEQYEGQLAHDQGLLAQAQMDQKRYQTLAQQNSIARQQSEDKSSSFSNMPAQ
jgi:multidrug efflux system membrane fusion protein